jgi:hypothetical protein
MKIRRTTYFLKFKEEINNLDLEKKIKNALNELETNENIKNIKITYSKNEYWYVSICIGHYASIKNVKSLLKKINLEMELQIFHNKNYNINDIIKIIK